MASEATLNIREWKKFDNKLLKKLKRGDKLLRTAFFVVGFGDLIDHFKKQAGPTSKWKKRKASTQKAYRNIGSGKWKAPKGAQRRSFSTSNKLLQLSGDLRKSILPKQLKRKTRRIGKNAIALISDLKYSRDHDEGSKKKKIPQRNYMWLSGKAQKSIVLNVLDLALRGLR